MDYALSDLVSLLTLTLLEIVLGVDNIIFVAILVAKLPAAQQEKARKLGLLAAMVFRVMLLLAVSWLASLTTPLIAFREFTVSGRDLILLAGGLFLIGKATLEIHDKLEGEEHSPSTQVKAALGAVIFQIIVIDLVFSIDSVITAVGMAQKVEIMILAVVLSMGVMLAAAPKISAVIEKHPTIKVLALSFLLMVGLVLAAEGLHFHVPKGYVYFAMAFSLAVEVLNIRTRKGGTKPVQLRDRAE